MDSAKIVAFEKEPPDMASSRPSAVFCRYEKYCCSSAVLTKGTGIALPIRYSRTIRRVKRIFLRISSILQALRKV